MKYTKQQQEEVKHFLEFLDIRTGIKNLEFSNADVITDMQEEIERLNHIIKYTDSWIDRTIEIIKQQPSEDDTWILERLKGIKQCLKGADKEC